MTAFATLFFRMGMAIVAIVAVMATASGLMSSPVDSGPKLTSDSGAVWTSRPVRVDRASQDYVRIQPPADPYPFKFSARRGVAVLDNATFSLNGQTYLVDGIARLDPKGLCRNDEGRILACGAGGRASLRAALLGGSVECARTEIARGVYIARCRSGGQDIAERLRAAGSTGLVASAGAVDPGRPSYVVVRD